MRMVVDVMGGDHGPGVVIEGARLALQSHPSIDGVVSGRPRGGDPGRDDPCGPARSRVKIVHASEMLTMDDKPVEGLRRKKDCSILRAVELLKEGKADALISPGNTGGIVAASTIRLRPLEGLDRPGIATVIPAPKNEFVLLDAGASVECRPTHLLHFAIMGSIYSREILGCKNPRVGIYATAPKPTKARK